MKKVTYYILSISSFFLFLAQWSPWAPWPAVKEGGAKPNFSYLGADVHWLGLEQHFWTSILAGFTLTFLAAAVFSGEEDEDDEDDEDF